MSHIVSISTQVRDPGAMAAACRRLGLGAPERGTTRLYGGEATGLMVRLPGWHYPVVIDTDSGQIAYDNFEGHWGDSAQLGRFLQAYAVEKSRIEAMNRGHSLVEQTLRDGSIRLTISVGGSS